MGKYCKEGQLIKWNGKSLGYVLETKGDMYRAQFSDEVGTIHHTDWLSMGESGLITDVWDVVDHTPKKKLPTKPYEELMSYKSWVSGEIVYGVFSKKDYGTKGQARYWGHFSCNDGGRLGFLHEGEIHSVEDIIVPPQEEKLTVSQEAANFGYTAIQGIVSAQEDKNEPKLSPPFKLRQSFTREEFLQYGKECYLQGQEDEYRREKPKKKEKTLKDAYAEGWNNCLENFIDNEFSFNDFDESVKRTWKDQSFKDAVSNAALGLTGEAGEVADLIKKAIYHGRGFNRMNGIVPMSHIAPKDSAVSVNDVKDELSDVLFYVSAMAQEFGFTLEEVARHNKSKLAKRYEKGFTVEESAQKKDKHVDVTSKHLIVSNSKGRIVNTEDIRKGIN